MRKKTIAIFFLVGVVLAILGGVLYGIGIASAVSTTTTGVYGSSTVPASLGPTFFVGLILLIIGGIASTIGWIGALVATAKLNRWGWFVAVFLLTGLGELIYLIAGPSAES